MRWNATQLIVPLCCPENGLDLLHLVTDNNWVVFPDFSLPFRLVVEGTLVFVRVTM